MSFACSYEVPADERLYERVRNEIGEAQPDGLVVHLVLKTSGGLRHIGVWDSKADWERFRDDRVRPAVGRAMRAAGFAAPPPPPAEEELGVVDVITHN